MGNCISSPEDDGGISPQHHGQKTNRATFNNNNNLGKTAHGVRGTKAIKRPRKKVHKGLIGLPSNFQHTGHIGIAEMRSGKVDPEKIRNQMAEVAAALRLEGLNFDLSGSNSNDNSNNKNNNNIRPESSSEAQTSQSILPLSNPPPIHTTSEEFKIKRKPTINSTHSCETSLSSTESTQKIEAEKPLDPIAEVVAALKMPADMNFDLQTTTSPTNNVSSVV